MKGLCEPSVPQASFENVEQFPVSLEPRRRSGAWISRRLEKELEEWPEIGRRDQGRRDSVRLHTAAIESTAMRVSHEMRFSNRSQLNTQVFSLDL
jgi:hypothetical protein